MSLIAMMWGLPLFQISSDKIISPETHMLFLNILQILRNEITCYCILADNCHLFHLKTYKHTTWIPRWNDAKNEHFYVVSIWNPRGVFVERILTRKTHPQIKLKGLSINMYIWVIGMFKYLSEILILKLNLQKNEVVVAKNHFLW